MSLVAALKALAAVGGTPDQLIAIVEAHEASRLDDLAKRRAADAARQQARRDRSKHHVTSRDITVRHGTSRDSSPHVGERAQVVTLSSSLRSEGTQEANASFVDATSKAPTPADPEKPETKPPKAVRGTRLPEAWEPSDAEVELARGEGLTDEEITRAALEFRNYWCSRSRDATKLDWSRTWHNRVLEVADRKRRTGARVAAAPGEPGGGRRGAVSFADIYARRHGPGEG